MEASWAASVAVEAKPVSDSSGRMGGHGVEKGGRLYTLAWKQEGDCAHFQAGGLSGRESIGRAGVGSPGHTGGAWYSGRPNPATCVGLSLEV